MYRVRSGDRDGHEALAQSNNHSNDRDTHEALAQSNNHSNDRDTHEALARSGSLTRCAPRVRFAHPAVLASSGDPEPARPSSPPGIERGTERGPALPQVARASLLAGARSAPHRSATRSRPVDHRARIAVSRTGTRWRPCPEGRPPLYVRGLSIAASGASEKRKRLGRCEAQAARLTNSGPGVLASGASEGVRDGRAVSSCRKSKIFGQLEGASSLGGLEGRGLRGRLHRRRSHPSSHPSSHQNSHHRTTADTT